jgi:hypothetical protein
LGPYSVAAAAAAEKSAPGREEEEPLPPRVAAAIIPESENLLLRLQAEIQARASATFGGTSLEVGVETSAEAPVRVLLLEYSMVFFVVVVVVVREVGAR